MTDQPIGGPWRVPETPDELRAELERVRQERAELLALEGQRPLTRGEGSRLIVLDFRLAVLQDQSLGWSLEAAASD